MDVGVGVGPSGVAVGVLVLVGVGVGVGVLLGKVGSGDGVTDGLSVLSGSGVAEGRSGCDVQVGASVGSEDVGVGEGISKMATSVGSPSSDEDANELARVGNTRPSRKKASCGTRSGAKKKSAIKATSAMANSNSNAAAKLINLPIHPVCCRLFAISTIQSLTEHAYGGALCENG